MDGRFGCGCGLGKQQATEKWSSVRLSSDSKNKMKVENHISVHSNLNLNGFSNSGGTDRSHKNNIGKEVIWWVDAAADVVALVAASVTVIVVVDNKQYGDI